MRPFTRRVDYVRTATWAACLTAGGAIAAALVAAAVHGPVLAWALRGAGTGLAVYAVILLVR